MQNLTSWRHLQTKQPQHELMEGNSHNSTTTTPIRNFYCRFRPPSPPHTILPQGSLPPFELLMWRSCSRFYLSFVKNLNKISPDSLLQHLAIAPPILVQITGSLVPSHCLTLSYRSPPTDPTSHDGALNSSRFQALDAPRHPLHQHRTPPGPYPPRSDNFGELSDPSDRHEPSTITQH